MSSITTRDTKSNFLAADSNRSKLFLFDNVFESGTMLNAGTPEATFLAGTLLGRIGATNRLVPLTSAATDGSEFPVGILAQDVTIAGGGTATAPVTMCVGGEVLKSGIIFAGSDTYTTVVATRTLADRIMADTLGIKLVAVEDCTFYDN